MRYIKQVMVALLVLLFCGTSWGESDKKVSAKFVKNITITHAGLNAQKDADVFIYTLTQLHEDNAGLVVNFMEYMLDVIVCESWQNKDRLNEDQPKRAMKVLYSIKEYREQNPVKNEGQIDPREISILLPQFDATYAEKSKIILAGL